MIAVDRYNALYTVSQYGQTMSVHKRRLVPASELRLARALRVLERPAPALGLHVAAPARHDRISQRSAVSAWCMGLDASYVVMLMKR